MNSTEPASERNRKRNLERLLSEILYYDLSQKRHRGLLTSLREYRLIVRAFAESLLAFENGELEKFDSLVGENACQIRAVRIASIHSHHSIDVQSHHNRCQSVLKTIDTLLVPRTISRMMMNNQSLTEIIDEHDLDISLSRDAMFILESYLLTEMKEELLEKDHFMLSLFVKQKCNPNKIKRIDPEVSFSFCDQLASHLRQKLSSSSVQYVRDTAEKLQNPYLMRMVSDDFTVTHNALPCIPMFWTYKILLQAAKLHQLPLVVRIKFIKSLEDGGYKVKEDDRVLFFRPGGALGEIYTLDTPEKHDLEKAAWVIQGIASSGHSWDSAVLEQSIINAILAGAADHRLYPGADRPIHIDDSEYEHYRAVAKSHGFSSENPSTFFIQHVYPSQIKNHLH